MLELQSIFFSVSAIQSLKKARWIDSMLQILVIYNYLLIKKMTDLNYFTRKETICTNSGNKVEKSCLDFFFPFGNLCFSFV